MAKKKDEKDVLVVRDEKTGEISVVAGLNADGTPKRTPAKAENAQSFLQFDRHGDVLDNFFKNFFRQCKEPSRFGFYRIAADQAENLLEVMKQLLKDPEANKELLAPHKVDTSDYEKKVQEEMAAQQTEKQEPQKQENMEQRKEQQQDKSEQMQGKRGYQPIDESKINWQELEDRWGVKRDNLEKSGDLTKMLNYGKSDLVKVKPTFGGESFELDARLSFKKDGEGNISLVPHFIRKEQKLDEYEFAVRETKTYEVIEDVKEFRSEIGIIYINDFNQKVLTKMIKESDLEFHPILDCGVYVYLWKGHPLANKEEISIEELEEYPCLAFEQGN